MNNPTAAVIIIGNEILSGRTCDLNLQHIALGLASHGIDLKESRVISDDHKAIVATINELKPKYNYIFTTGGIGPTHDDITSQAVASAFGLDLELNQEAYALLSASYRALGYELNDARKKMAYIPRGAKLIDNSVSAAPGFSVENVYVLAGVPHIMRDMFDNLLPSLPKGKVVKSHSLDLLVGESLIAKIFSDLQEKYPTVEMGSYPFQKEGLHATSLVLRSSDEKALAAANAELSEAMKGYF